MKTCKICKIEKDEKMDFSPCGKYKDKIYYRGECKDCNLKIQASDQTAQIKYRNSENGRAKKKAYKQTQQYKQNELERQRIRYNTDSMYALKRNLRRRLSKALESKKWIKSNHFAQYIGCTLEELKSHLEIQFTEGMTWNNYGIGEKCWTIDHIIPLSLAKTEEEMYKLCHYTNLKPMWYLDNIHKSDKIQ